MTDRMNKINKAADELRGLMGVQVVNLESPSDLHNTIANIVGEYSVRPYPGHRFYSERYDDKLLATIALNREGKWSAEDQQAALEILAYTLDYPRR